MCIARTEDVDDDLDVDLADPIEGAPEEGVLVEQLAGPSGFHVTAAKLDAVTFEQPQLPLGHDEGGVLDGALQSQQALEPGLQIVPTPDAAHARDADVDALEAQFVGDTLGAVGGVLQGVGEDLALDFLRDAVGMGPRGPRRCSTRAATPPTRNARRTS